MWNFLCDPVVRNLPSDAGDMGSVPGWESEIPHGTERLSWCETPRANSNNQCSQININILKRTQKCASDSESGSCVLTFGCLSLSLVSGRVWKTSAFLSARDKRERQIHMVTLYLWNLNKG